MKLPYKQYWKGTDVLLTADEQSYVSDDEIDCIAATDEEIKEAQYNYAHDIDCEHHLVTHEYDRYGGTITRCVICDSIVKQKEEPENEVYWDSLY